MEVSKNSISQFIMASKMTFMVPVFQRNYAWEDEDCKRLWYDLEYVLEDETETRRHFLGTICSKTLNSREKIIIDGQQRLTTVTLLLKAMRDCVDDAEFKTDIDEHYLKNVGYGIKPQHKIKLHLNRLDDNAWRWLLDNSPAETERTPDPSVAGSRVYRNYVLFCDLLHDMPVEKVVELKDALERMTIVDLDVEAEDPQEIFDSLNSTGRKLEPVDLLRNFMLMSLDRETQQHFYDDYWYPIERNVHADMPVKNAMRDGNMVRFFVDYLIYTRKSDATTVRGRRAHINANNLHASFMNYYASMSGDRARYTSDPDVTECILSDMHDASVSYGRLVFPDSANPETTNGIDAILHDIVVGCDAIASRPLLLHVLERLRTHKIDETQAKAMLECCRTMAMRARVCRIGFLDGQFCGNVLQHLDADPDGDPVRALWRAVTSGQGSYAFPSDELFERSLCERSLFESLRSEGTKRLLYAIESHAKDAKELPPFDSDAITVEHVMPQRLSAAWKAALGSEVRLHRDFVHRLGNLALTGYNGQMSNRPFDEKRVWYAQSSFPHTRDLTDLDAWSIEAIMDRGERLAAECVSIWSVPDGYKSLVNQ